jgi:hypothetical protein
LRAGPSGVCQRTTMRIMFYVYVVLILAGIAGFMLISLLER